MTGHFLSNARRFLLIIFLLAFVVACDNSAPEDTVPVKTYRMAMDDAPVSLDPVRSATLYSKHIVVNVYDTLYRYKYLARPYELTPNLAVAMPQVSADGKTYTIKIKQGVYFFDDPAFPGGKGREVMAEDFIYSIKRHFDPVSKSQGAWLWQGRIVGLDDWKEQGADYSEQVEGLQAVDRYTIQIKLTAPYPQILHTLALGFAGVVPNEAVTYYGEELSSNPVGSGPYRVAEFNSSGVTLIRNPQYRDETVNLKNEGFDPIEHNAYGVSTVDGKRLPILDRIEVSFISEPVARWNSFLKEDEVEFASVPPEMFDAVLEQRQPDLRPTSSFAEKYRLKPGLESGFIRFDFNLADPEIGYNGEAGRNQRNKALRCAIQSAMDLQELNQKFYGDLGVTYNGAITPSMQEYRPGDSGNSSRNPEVGRQLLEDAGWNEDNLPVIDFGTTSSVQSRQVYELFRSWLADIGYPGDKVVLRAYPSVGTFYKAVTERQMNFFFISWTLDYPDSENSLQLFYGPNATPGVNSSNYNNDAYDRLFEQVAAMRPSTDRTQLAQQMNNLLIDDCVTKSGLSRTKLYAWHKDVIVYPDRDIVGGYYLPFVDKVD